MAIEQDIQGKLDQMAEAAKIEQAPVFDATTSEVQEAEQGILAQTGLQVETYPEYEQEAGLGTKLIKKFTKKSKGAADNVVEEVTETAAEETPTIIERVKKATKAAEERSVMIEESPPPKIDGPRITVVPEDEAGMASFIDGLGAVKGKGVNLVNIIDETTGEIQDTFKYLNAVKNANPELIEAARRGTINMDKLMEAAQARGMDDVVIQFLERQPGQVFNAEDFVAGFLSVVSVQKQTQALNKKAILKNATEADKLAFINAMNLEAELWSSVSGVVSESARTMYAVSQLSQTMNISGDVIRGRAEKLRDISQTFGGKENFDTAIILYNSLTDPAQAAEFVRKGRVARTIDAVMEAYINSILSSPVTHAVNVFSNFLRLAADIPETALAGAIGKARTSLGIGSKERVYASEAFASMSDFVPIMQDAFLLGGKVFKTGEPLSDATKLELRNRRAITAKNFEIPDDSLAGRAVDLLGTYYRLPGRFLVTEDEFFKSIASQHLLRKAAKRESLSLRDDLIRKGKSVEFADQKAALRYAKVMKSPPEYIVNDVREAAKEMVFQGDLPKFLADLEPFFNNPITKVIVPFYKTPSNVVLAAAERSPLALANPKFYQTIKAGGPEADLALSKFTLGSSAMGWLAYNSFGGGENENVRIIGSGPEDLDAMRNMQAMGLMPYTINFRQEDGTWKGYQYNQLGPHALLMAMSADFAYYAQHEDDSTILDGLAYAATVGIAEFMTQLPMVEGLSDIASAFGKDHKGWEKKMEKFRQTLGEKVTSVGLNVLPGVSSGWAAVERFMMPDGSSTLLPKEGLAGGDPTRLPAFARGFYEALQKAKARNPFFSKELPPKLNRWAEVVPQGKGSGWEFFSPMKTYSGEYSKVGKELEDLKAGVTMPDKKKGDVIFNAEQYNFLVKTAMTVDAAGRMPGESSASGNAYDPTMTMYQVMSRRIDSPDYRLLSKKERADLLQGIASDFDRMALERLKLTDRDLATRLMLED
jgi:hypothetical protein